MPQIMPIDTDLLNQWATEKLDSDAVKTALQARGLDTDSIDLYLAAYRKLRNTGKQFSGFVCCGIGAFLGFLGCVLSMVNPAPELYGFFLYGLTSIAILVIVAGLYLLFE